MNYQFISITNLFFFLWNKKRDQTFFTDFTVFYLLTQHKHWHMQHYKTMLKINPLLYFILFLIYDILGKSSLLKWRLTNVLWSLTHQQKPKTLVRSTTWNDERLIWNCSWNKVAEGSIVFPACHLWFSISKKCWSLELENSGAPGRTLVPPHRDQSAGRAQFSVCKPSQRSKSDTDKRQTSIIFYFFYLNGQTTYTFWI